MVTAVDTWNLAPAQGGNMVDAAQDDICMHSGSFSNDRISCRWINFQDCNGFYYAPPFNECMHDHFTSSTFFLNNLS